MIATNIRGQNWNPEEHIEMLKKAIKATGEAGTTIGNALKSVEKKIEKERR